MLCLIMMKRISGGAVAVVRSASRPSAATQRCILASAAGHASYIAPHYLLA